MKHQVDPLDQSSVDVIINDVESLFINMFVVVAIYYFLEEWINAPLTFMEVWASKGGLVDGLQAVWFIFAWAIGGTLLINVLRGDALKHDPATYLIKGTWLSLNAGFFEELTYRWLRLFGAMVALKILNIITFGLVEWIYTVILIPLANWASFGLLSAQFNGPYEWLFAAAIVVANIHFRDGHKYQGTFGMINAWYMGLFFFYLTFNFGLGIAILAHILYDVCVFWTIGLIARFQQRSALA